MTELTQKQRNVYDFILQFIKEHQYPPTVREIGDFFSISSKASHDYIKILNKKKLIEYTPKKSRSIKILAKQDLLKDEISQYIQKIPILGKVAAGIPLFSSENYDGFLPIAIELLPANKEYFCLKVQGDSMINAGIIEGDYVIIQKNEWAPNGSIVVAKTNEGAVTLKRFFKESNRFSLKAENSAYPPIYSSAVTILGTLHMMIRKFN